MQAGELITSDAQYFEDRVLVNGAEWPTESWSVKRELSGDLPRQVTAVSGVTQATAQIEWTPREDVTTTEANPWLTPYMFPRRGDRVEIFVSDGETEWKQFHGRIDTTIGDIKAGYSSTCIDDYDKLSSLIEHAPLLRVMPPYSEGGETRGVGLTPTYYVDLALRASGFYVTPSNEHRCVLHVPAQGSMWPYQGSFGAMTSGTSYDGDRQHARNFAAPWGWAVSNFDCIYRPRLSFNRSAPLQMTFLRAPNHHDQFTFDAVYGEGSGSVRVRVAAWGNGNVNAYLGSDTICGLTAEQLDGSTIITLLVKNGRWTLKGSNGATDTGTATIPTTQAMHHIHLIGHDGARVAGMQVGHPEQSHHEFRSLDFTPSAQIHVGQYGDFINYMDAGKVIYPTQAHALLQEIGDATLSATWIDEVGLLHFMPSMILNSKSPVRTVTTQDDVAELHWEDNLLGTRSRVIVNYDLPTIGIRRAPSIDVYVGNIKRLESGEEVIDFVGQGSDEDWIMPSVNMTQLGVVGWSPYNAGKYTQGGMFYVHEGGEISPTDLYGTVEMETVGMRRYKITHNAGTLPPGTTANTGTSPNASTLWEHNRNQPLPVIRAYGRVQWMSDSITPITAFGSGPELIHDAGHWHSRTNNTNQLVDIGNYLASQTSMPHPIIRNLRIIPDPRLQLGDMIRIQSDLMQVTMNALITAVDTSFDATGLSMTLRVRITRVVRTADTYANMNDERSNTTYQQWNTAVGDQQYSQLTLD